MADVGVFSRYKGFNDYQDEAQKNNLAAALMSARIAKTSQPGGNLPAAIQITNEMEKALQAGDTGRFTLLSQVAKSYNADRGILPNIPEQQTNNLGAALTNALPPVQAQSAPQGPGLNFASIAAQGNPNAPAPVSTAPGGTTVAANAPAAVNTLYPAASVIPGFAQASGVIEGEKERAKEQAKSNVELSMKPKIGYTTKVAEGAGATVTKNNETLGNLDSMMSSIEQARVILPKVSATGPIAGRAGALAEDPDYKNLQGALNGIVLQAKDLYNLGSGQGFTDADRDFLQQTIAGKYARAETIGAGLDRMEQALQHRAAFLSGQNANTNNQYGGVNITPAANKETPAETKANFNASRAPKTVNYVIKNGKLVAQ